MAYPAIRQSANPANLVALHSITQVLHMMREPEKHFPPHVKTLLMSQSDFSLPDYPERDYSVAKEYDFTYSGSDRYVHSILEFVGPNQGRP